MKQSESKLQDLDLTIQSKFKRSKRRTYYEPNSTRKSITDSNIENLFLNI